MALPAPKLLLITDRKAAARPLDDIVDAAIRGGVRWIMVREKDLPTPELTQLAAAILARAHPFGAQVVVNGDVNAALAAEADGVHLQSTADVAQARDRLGDGRLIGISTHSLNDVKAASLAGVDYVTVSPVFATPSKPGYGPVLGIEGLKSACAMDIPVLALAGINAANAAVCIEASAAGVAVMGGIMNAHDPEATAREIIAALKPSQ